MSKKKSITVVDPIFAQAKATILANATVQMDRNAAVSIYCASIVIAAFDRLTKAVEANTRIQSAAASNRGEL